MLHPKTPTIIPLLLLASSSALRLEPSWHHRLQPKAARHPLSEIEILGSEDFRLHTTALPFPLVVRQGSLESQARHLRALLPRLSASAGKIDAVDLRFARRIIIKLPPSKDGRNDEQRA